MGSFAISSIRKRLRRSTLEGLTPKFLENADHGGIRQQLKGAPASTSTQFGCPLSSQISDEFSSAEEMTPNKWSETVCTHTTLCAQNPAFTPGRSKAKTCAYSATPMTSYRLQAGFTCSIRLEPSGPTSAGTIYLSRHL